MRASPFIGLLDGQLEQYGRPYYNVISVDLPLWDGNKVSHALMFHERIETDQSFETLFPNAIGELIK